MSEITEGSRWDDDKITRLKTFWAEGLTTAEIGRRLGVTKNAVVGKVSRLHLPGRPSPIRRTGAAGPTAASEPAPPPTLAEIMPAPAVSAAPQVAEALPLPATAPIKPKAAASQSMRRGSGGQCCWPLGEPGRPGFRFCDAPLPPRTTYCTAHARLAYVRTPRPDERAYEIALPD